MTRLGDLFAGAWAALGARPHDALYRRVPRGRECRARSSGPSRLLGLGIQHDEVGALFAGHWDVEALAAEPGAMSATYWMTRNDEPG